MEGLILPLAREEPLVGLDADSRGAANLRHEISCGTIANGLKAAGLEPAPERSRGMTWKEFLKAHWEVLAATDFFTVELWSTKGLVRYHVLVVIELATREVEIADLVPEPSQSWMSQWPGI